jgi:hypothetical protein
VKKTAAQKRADDFLVAMDNLRADLAADGIVIDADEWLRELQGEAEPVGRPISTLLPAALPPLTLAEVAAWCDSARTVFCGGKFSAAVKDSITTRPGALRETLRCYIDDVRQARRRGCSDTHRYEATVLMLWRLSREMKR